MLVAEIRRELKNFAYPEVRKKGVEWERQYVDDPRLYRVATPDLFDQEEAGVWRMFLRLLTRC